MLFTLEQSTRPHAENIAQRLEELAVEVRYPAIASGQAVERVERLIRFCEALATA